MRKLLILPFVYLFTCSNSQDVKRKHTPPPDQLKRYSYPVYTFTSNVEHDGTGFLYKSGAKVFIVTNYHIRGMNPFDAEILYDADTLYLKYQLLNTNEYRIAKVKINSGEHDSIRVFKPHEDLDLYGVELNPIPKNANLNYINDFIDRNYFDKIPDSLIVYGFSTPGGFSADSFYSKQSLFKGDYQTNFIDLDSTLRHDYPSQLELIYRAVPMFKENYFLSAPMAEHGYSGSPAFGIFKTDSNTLYKFMGVIFGSQGQLKKTWGINPKTFVEWATKLH